MKHSPQPLSLSTVKEKRGSIEIWRRGAWTITEEPAYGVPTAKTGCEKKSPAGCEFSWGRNFPLFLANMIARDGDRVGTRLCTRKFLYKKCPGREPGGQERLVLNSVRFAKAPMRWITLHPGI
jgi:hypothetical protein